MAGRKICTCSVQKKFAPVFLICSWLKPWMWACITGEPKWKALLERTEFQPLIVCRDAAEAWRLNREMTPIQRKISSGSGRQGKWQPTWRRSSLRTSVFSALEGRWRKWSANACIHLYIRTYTCTHVNTHLYIHMLIHTHSYVNVSAYTHTYIQT